MDPASVTAAILTRNEERNLPRALAGLPPGMPVLVLDAGSTDGTVALARASGAHVIERAWTDFIDARRFALDQVTTPWVLMLDADEALDGTLRDAIADASGDADGYALKRTTYFRGRALRQWRGERLVRLFRIGRARLVAQPAAGGDAALHERWVLAGEPPILAGTLEHDSYPDRASYRRKYAAYVAIESAGMHGSLRAVAVQSAAGALRFGWLLVRRGAVLDGPDGVYVAWMSAFYPAAVAWSAWRSRANPAP